MSIQITDRILDHATDIVGIAVLGAIALYNGQPSPEIVAGVVSVALGKRKFRADKE